MVGKGNLRKMVGLLGDPIQYHFVLNDDFYPLNEYLGRNIQLIFEGNIHCISCGRSIKKSYQQGYCFPCTQKLAACDFCILKPALCHYHQGTCREPEWGLNHCFIPHVVYLTNTSQLKIGITRKTQIPVRWIDQGAVQALPLYEVQSRYQSGLIEEVFSLIVQDKTNWRAMLKGIPAFIDLFFKRDELIRLLNSKLRSIVEQFDLDSVRYLEDAVSVELVYPVLHYPSSIKSLGFDKTNIIEGVLLGIKGQYLIFEKGVFSVRKHIGYEISFKAN